MNRHHTIYNYYNNTLFYYYYYYYSISSYNYYMYILQLQRLTTTNHIKTGHDIHSYVLFYYYSFIYILIIALLRKKITILPHAVLQQSMVLKYNRSEGKISFVI